MLKTNTFRPDRYLRSKFLEGRYLLATELVDVQLELLDHFRKSIKVSVGNVAVGTAWEVSYYDVDKVLIKPGTAWYEGLPFDFRSATDEMLTEGYLPTDVDFDKIANTGVVLTFSNTTPSDEYRIIISAEESIVTDIQDPFIKNANIPEATAQKVKLKYKVHVVPASEQDPTAAVFKNEALDRNLSNYVEVINTASSAGSYQGSAASSIPENIDGSNLELSFKNISGSNPLPIAPSDRDMFVNGILTDTVGQDYYITAMFTDPSNSDLTVIRVDVAVDQPNPTFNIGSAYRIYKREIYVTDSSGSGSPVGKIYWTIGEATWDSIGQFYQHPSKVVDLRERIVSEVDYETAINEKLNLQLTGGGIIDLETDGETLHWDGDFTLVNPGGASFTVPADTAVLVEGGSLAYEIGTAPLGALSVTASSVSGNDVTLVAIDLTTIRVGNVVKIGSETAEITAIDNSNDIITVTPAIVGTGAGFIYRDSFGPGAVKLNENTFILAVKEDSKVRVGNYLELSAGESNATYDTRILIGTTPGYLLPLTAGDDVILPDNPRTSRPQYYSAIRRNLEVYVNQLLKYQGIDWTAVDEQTIQFTYDLPLNSEIHFRIDSLPAGSLGGGGGGGGGGTLQDAYDGGNTIAVTAGIPVTLTGTGTVIHVQADIEIDGVIL
jgi:hypothetical protein